jgi:hypothetical protein
VRVWKFAAHEVRKRLQSSQAQADRERTDEPEA